MNTQPVAAPIKMRIMCSSEEIEKLTDELIDSLPGLQLIERSKPYPCRAPDEDKSRVYLTFIRS